VETKEKAKRIQNSRNIIRDSSKKKSNSKPVITARRNNIEKSKYISNNRKNWTLGGILSVLILILGIAADFITISTSKNVFCDLAIIRKICAIGSENKPPLDDRPNLVSFSIDRRKVSTEDYRKQNSDYTSNENTNAPADNIDWKDANGYCTRIGNMSLPSKEEWELAKDAEVLLDIKSGAEWLDDCETEKCDKKYIATIDGLVPTYPTLEREKLGFRCVSQINLFMRLKSGIQSIFK